MRYSVIEVVSGEVIRANVGMDEAYRVRDQHQESMLRAGRTLLRKRYGLRVVEHGATMDEGCQQ